MEIRTSMMIAFQTLRKMITLAGGNDFQFCSRKNPFRITSRKLNASSMGASSGYPEFSKLLSQQYWLN